MSITDGPAPESKRAFADLFSSSTFTATHSSVVTASMGEGALSLATAVLLETRGLEHSSQL